MDYSETDDPQALEITALKAIYGDDFIECPPPKVWKGAARLPEFNIRVGHPDPEHQVKINLYLNVKFPKSYPHLAPATFTIQKPHNGLSSGDISKLGQAINAESQRLKGSEMVMEIVEFTQHWLKSHIVPTIEAPGSLALQKNLRARDEERARTQRLAEQELLAEAQARAEQQALEEQIEADMLRQIEAHRRRGRARAGSEATEVQFHRYEDDQDLSNEGEQDGDGGEVVLYGERERDRDMITEEFGLVEVDEKRRFSAVRLFHPRPDGLGTIYTADPILDDPSLPTPPLELFVVTFDAPYYTQSQGRKKLRQVEAEVRRLVGIRHPNLISVYAVKLYLPIQYPESYSSSSFPSSSSYSSSYASYGSAGMGMGMNTMNTPRGEGVFPQLMVLSEQFPALTLRDVLEDCESLREERASEYLVQILGALNVVHVADLVHRGISPRCIGLTAKDQQSQKQIKLGRVGYYTRLLDLHRSNPFGTVNVVGKESSEDGLSEGWLSRDVKNESSLLYTRQRDIHAVGIVLLQMLIGLNVTDRFDDVHSALQAYSSMISPSLARLASNMILPPKKSHINCLSLLGDLSEASFRTAHHTSGHAHHMNGGPRSPQISFSDPRTPNPHAYNAQGHYGGQQGMISASPEIDYFRLPLRKQSSRWKEDWEELELLGRGAFGSVVKAKNRIDGRIYAVKKIRLKTEKSDNKIFREVNALSRLSHRFIVRYYTTWVEFAEPVSTAASDDSSTEYSNSTSVPNEASERHLPRNGMSIDLDDLDEMSGSKSSDFPSIHFGGSGSSPGSSSEEDEGEGVFESLFEAQPRTAMPGFGFSVARTLYIQMEFVERQTLKEMVDEGISENEAWRLFLQILDALVHMSSLGILHRDIKLTNIFIDGKGDCKVGDFGLATSSLAAVDPSDVSPLVAVPDADMTLEVGTRLYIAPEVLSRKRGPRNHTKADMYSLGIVFFEMNYQFSTGAERIAVIEDLRKPDILFPAGWQQRRSRQKDIIKALLDHDPSKRPSALELSHSSMLPPKAEDEYFKGALEMMAKSDSPHHQVLLGSLFSQTPKPSRGFLYDAELNPPEHTALNDNVQERLTALFRLLGAIDMEPPLLMPVIDPSDMDNQPSFIDNRGDMVYLPSNLFTPFARHAARKNIRRIKRYHIANIYKSAVVPGHPVMQKAAILDIISQDLQHGPIAAAAEIIAVANDVLNSFPNLSQSYDIHVSHNRIIELALNRVSETHRATVVDILNQTKSSPSQKRALLLKQGLLRSSADELEILCESDEDIDRMLSRLEKASPTLVTMMQSAVNEIRTCIQFAVSTGVTRTIHFHPLMLGSHLSIFKDGVIMEVVKKSDTKKKADILAYGGRYDNYISRFTPKQKPDGICAVGIQISIEKITAALAAYQSTSVKTLVKEERSFGFWSPRRCDVYVVSYHPGYLQERLEVASYLWRHNISADIMYESGSVGEDHESHVDICAREGILFTVYPRPRAGRVDHAAFKVKSILKGTEYEVNRQELVSFLQHQIAEQKRIDLTTSGAPTLDTTLNPIPAKEPSVASDVQLLLPIDAKKQRKQVKSLFLDRAFDKSLQIKSSFQSGMPTLAVDVSQSTFEAMVRNSAWVVDDEAWKAILPGFPNSTYALQVREAAAKRKSEGHAFILIYAVKEERVQLLALN